MRYPWTPTPFTSRLERRSRSTMLLSQRSEASTRDQESESESESYRDEESERKSERASEKEREKESEREISCV